MIEPISFSRLKHINQSPAHFRHVCQTPVEETDPMRLGSATHCLIYEPDAYGDRFAVFDGRRAGKDWTEFQAQLGTRTALTRPQDTTAHAIAEAVRAHPVVAEWLSDPAAIVERRLFWTDPITGLKLAGTPDYIGAGAVIDLKTTGTVIPARFERSAADLFYHAQLALYWDGAAANNIPVTEARLIVVESSEPYDVIPYIVPQYIIDLGRYRYSKWLQQVKECIAENRWPGVAPAPIELMLPEWAFQKHDLALTLGGTEVSF